MGKGSTTCLVSVPGIAAVTPRVVFRFSVWGQGDTCPCKCWGDTVLGSRDCAGFLAFLFPSTGNLVHSEGRTFQ